MESIFKTTLRIALILVCSAYSFSSFAGEPENERLNIRAQSEVAIGDLTMTVAEVEKMTEEGAFGVGEMFVPMLNQTLKVRFKNLRKDAIGSIESGEVIAQIDQSWLQNFGFETLNAANFSTLESAMSFLKAGENRVALPIRIDDLPAYDEMDFGYNRSVLVTELIFKKEGTTASVISLEQTPEDAFLPFAASNLKVENDKIEFCETSLFLTTDTNNPDFQLPITFKAHNPNSGEENQGTYMMLSCDGFEYFNIEAEYIFSKDKLLPANSSDTEVVATFKAQGVQVTKFLATATITPFMIKGVDDVIFTMEDAMIDYSDVENAENFPEDYFENEPDPLTWKGFYMKKAGVKFPEDFGFEKGGERFELSLNDMIYDRGNGATLKAAADNIPGVKGDIANWGLSLETVLMDFKKNSLVSFDFGGAIAIPIVKDENNSLRYNAKIRANPAPDAAKAELALSFTNDANFTLPFLSDDLGTAGLTLEKSSTAGIRYINQSYEPYAKLTGSIGIGIKSPEFEYAFDFEELTINDLDPSKVQGNIPRGRPGLGEITLKATDTSNAGDTGNTGGEEKQVSGFPIMVSGINFGKADGLEDVYKLGFTVAVNLAPGAKTISADGTFGIFSKLDYSKITSDRPYEAMQFEKFEVERLALDSDLGPVHIAGEMKFMNNDPIYGNGFDASISVAVNTGISFGAEGRVIFGKTLKSAGDYRYFYVFGKVKIPITIAPTPVTIYAFGGGMYYNMTKESGTENYLPKKGGLGFQAAIDVGLVKPGDLQFYSEAKLTVELDTRDWSLNKIELNGKIYMMRTLPTESLASAPGKGQLDVVFDNVNKTLDANLTVTLIKGPIVATGKAKMNVGFETGKWFVWIGTPKKDEDKGHIGPVSLDVGGFATFEAYFMIGNHNILPPKPLSEISSNFSGINVPREFGSTSSGVGFAFGAGLHFPRTNINFLAFRASLKAGMGFDGSLMKLDGTCRPGKSEFGINKWCFRGRAYAYFEGSLDLHVDIFFYEGWVNLASLDVGLAIEFEAPDPIWLKGYAKGKYSVLNGAIKGSFNFEIEHGERCNGITIPDPNPMAGLEIISDLEPKDNKTIQVFDDVAAAFNFQMSGVKNFKVTRADGVLVEKFYKCDIESYSLKETSTSRSVTLSKKMSSDNYNAYFTPAAALKAETNYKFKVSAGCYETNYWGTLKNGKPAANQQSKEVTFKTGKRPEKIYAPMIRYQMPGDGQKFWHKNYAVPMIDLKQEGYEYLFKDSEVKNGKRIYYDYKFRLTELSSSGNQEIGTYDINEKIGDATGRTRTQVEWVWAWPPIRTVQVPIPSKRVVFKKLNELNLDKRAKYQVEIIRVPKGITKTVIDESAIASSDNLGGVAGGWTKDENDEWYYASNKITTTNRRLSSSSSSSTQNEIAVLAKIEFGTSKYNSIKDKISLFVDNGGSAIASTGKPDEVKNDRYKKYLVGTKRHQVRFGTVHREKFDQYDMTKLMANSHFYVSTEGSIDYELYSRRIAKYEDDKYYRNNRTEIDLVRNFIAPNLRSKGKIDYNYLAYVQWYLGSKYPRSSGPKNSWPIKINTPSNSASQYAYLNINLRGINRHHVKIRRNMSAKLLSLYPKTVSVKKSRSWWGGFLGLVKYTKTWYVNEPNKQYVWRKQFIDRWSHNSTMHKSYYTESMNRYRIRMRYFDNVYSAPEYIDVPLTRGYNSEDYFSVNPAKYSNWFSN